VSNEPDLTMKVGFPRPSQPVSEPVGDPAGGYSPMRRLGGAARGGLMLPDAAPSAGTFYAPRGVWTDGTRVIVADSGNHRVLIWHTMPDTDGAPADVVLGQPDFTSEGPAAGGRGAAKGMHIPTGITVLDDGRLIVADAWHHRLLIWNELPTASDVQADVVLGQPDFTSTTENSGIGPTNKTFWWPFGTALINGTFWVADTGNRRVLGWSGGVPEPGIGADIVLGQNGFESREENRGGAVGPNTFRWPHHVAGDADTLWVADAGDHRVVAYSPAPSADRDFDALLGQLDFASSTEFPYGAQGNDKLRFPYALAYDNGRLAVADTSNNRVLLWDNAPRHGIGPGADHVIGQPDFAGNGENQWKSLTDHTLCWPYGLHLSGDLLAIADSGNNRVMLWQR